jgi:hypothetical protein
MTFLQTVITHKSLNTQHFYPGNRGVLLAIATLVVKEVRLVDLALQCRGGIGT